MVPFTTSFKPPPLDLGGAGGAGQAMGTAGGAMTAAAGFLPPQIGLPLMLLGGLFGAGQGAIGAWEQSRAMRDQETAAQLQRQRIMRLIERLENPDQTGLDAAASRAFSQAADQIDASTASRGTFRAGNQGAARLQADALANILAGLAQVRAQQETQNAQLIGGLLQDPSFGVEGRATNVPGNTVLGFLGGGFGGAGQSLGSLLNTPAGLEMLSGWLGGNQAGNQPGGQR